MTQKSDKHHGSDYILNQAVSKALLVGLILALIFMGIGILDYLLTYPSEPITQVLAINELLSGLTQGSPAAFLSLGIITLLLTPAIRVTFLLGGYMIRKQWLFAGISLFVLSILVISIFVGIHL